MLADHVWAIGVMFIIAAQSGGWRPRQPGSSSQGQAAAN